MLGFDEGWPEIEGTIDVEGYELGFKLGFKLGAKLGFKEGWSEIEGTKLGSDDLGALVALAVG